MLPELTRNIVEGRGLEAGHCSAALTHIFSDETCEDISIASFLSALSARGISPEALAGFADAMRCHARRVDYGTDNLLDTAGTGGGVDTFNISTTAAFVAAAAGVPVAKHGNRAMTSKSGSADVLEALGVNISSSASASRRVLEQAGISFMFAPQHHPAMKRVGKIRKKLGHRTVFNMLGPLTNPGGARIQLIGAYSEEAARSMAHALCSLGTQRAWVLHSLDGMDEISPLAATRIFAVGNNGVEEQLFDPAEYIAIQGSERDLAGGTATENAELTRLLLSGDQTRPAAFNAVLLNGAAAIHLAKDIDLKVAIRMSREILLTGGAMKVLDRLIEVTNAE